MDNFVDESANSHNVLRFADGPKVGHVESYFWRANDPRRRRAFWLKATILSGHTEAPMADVWCSTFDGESGRVWAARETVALDAARFEGTPLEIHIGQCEFVLDPQAGRAQGSLTNDQGSCTWDLSFTPMGDQLGMPLSIFPFRWMLDGGFPRSKTLTPHPCLAFNGKMTWSGTEVTIENWVGMQGHNWGKEHTPRYAWGQCVFLHEDQPVCMVEGFSGRIRVAGRLTPPVSALVVRHQGQELRFDKLLNLWNQSAELAYPKWALTMKGAQGEAELEMRAEPSRMVCLGYMNPNGVLSYCLNSKLAHTRLRVSPKGGSPFEYTSDSGGALEFLAPENPGFDHVV